MRTFWVVILITLILSSLVISEQAIIRGFCNEISQKLSSVSQKLSSGHMPHDDVSSIVKMWEKKKSAVFIFSNHSNFREIENNIYNLEFYSEHQNIKNSEFYVSALLHMVHELKEGCMFKKENIL